MPIDIRTRSKKRLATATAGCPFYQPGSHNCQAASHLWPLDTFERAGLCASDDYDDCPLFLCQALRSSRSLGPVRESLLLDGK
ncbi:MAG: hypothetical protein RQ723_10635 [Desulfuromonadales bacterium]|nr:hypothetical protein [Desulfuromonadales bacterium]